MARPVKRFVGERIGTPAMNVPAAQRVGVPINPDELHLLAQHTEVAG